MTDQPTPTPEPQPLPLGARLFLIPFLIVVACGLVLLIGRLLSAGPKTPGDYLEEIRSSGGNRRWQAAYELATTLDRQQMEVSPQVAGQMVALFQEPARDPRVKRYMALCLGKIGDPQAVPALIEATADPDPDTRLYAVWALGAIQDPRAGPALAALVDAEDDGLRTMVAYSLGTVEGDAAVEGLAKLLHDPRTDVRWNAAAALARHGDPGGVELLGDMLDRPTVEAAGLEGPQQDEVMLNALRALERLDDSRYDAKIAELKTADPSPTVRKAARAALEGRRVSTQ